MKEHNTILDYLIQVMVAFGVSVLAITVFCIIFGESAQGFSSMFELGSRGIPVKTVFQYLVLCALMVGVRFFFFTDRWIPQMALRWRLIGLLGVELLIVAAFIALCGWFPIGMWQPWALFFICFGVSFCGSYFVMRLKEETENRRLDEALSRWKEQEDAEK